uniref:Dolichol phosphate-mannose biosynthesis regulatory protein n=1 Tax=Tetranychus urticae TaxID=32264 RepID=T1KEI9_TETUR
MNWDRSIGLIALTTTGISLLTYSFFILIVPILPPMEIDADESFFSRGLLFWLITPPIAIASMIYLTSFIILFRLYMELKDGKKKQ